MQQSQLYVNDNLLDLPTDHLIALSYAVNTLTDLKSVQGNISNSISLPNTARNRMALGYPDDMNFNGASIIRKKLPCRYVQNGVDVIPNGILRILGASKGNLNVVISSGNTDFFDLLTGKLQDLDMSAYDHRWNQEAIMASRVNTEGYIYPIINYNTINTNSDTQHASGVIADEMRPAVFAKTLVKKIVELAGYKLINKIEDDDTTKDMYQNLLLPFSMDSFNHSQRYIKKNETNDILAKIEGLRTFDDPGGYGSDYEPGFTTYNDPLHSFDGVRFTAYETMRVDIDYAFDKVVSLTHDMQHADGAVFDLHVNSNIIASFNTRIEGDGVTLSQNGFMTRGEKTFNNLHISAKGVVLQPGDQVYLHIGALYGCYQDVYPNVTLTIKRTKELVYGEMVQIESVLPDMSQVDFLKFIGFLFCAIFQADNVNKTITIVPFGNILQNMPNAIDWSDKVTNGDESYDVTIGDYAQTNEAKWKHDDGVAPDIYGNGSFTIKDDNLDLYKNIYDLPFAASFDVVSLSSKLKTVYINKVPDVVADPNMVTPTEQRICLLNKATVPLTYYDFGGSNATVITDSIPLTRFAPDLLLPNIFDKFYADILNVLKDQRKLTCYLRLNEIDIQTLDFFKPVYISKYQSYFYISKITDFTGLKPCKVELIKLF